MTPVNNAGGAAVVGDGVGLPGIAAVAFVHGLAIMAFAAPGPSVDRGVPPGT